MLTAVPNIGSSLLRAFVRRTPKATFETVSRSRFDATAVTIVEAMSAAKGHTGYKKADSTPATDKATTAAKTMGGAVARINIPVCVAFKPIRTLFPNDKGILMTIIRKLKAKATVEMPPASAK
jgi:hypothetical protein